MLKTKSKSEKEIPLFSEKSLRNSKTKEKLNLQRIEENTTKKEDKISEKKNLVSGYNSIGLRCRHFSEAKIFSQNNISTLCKKNEISQIEKMEGIDKIHNIIINNKKEGLISLRNSNPFNVNPSPRANGAKPCAETFEHHGTCSKFSNVKSKINLIKKISTDNLNKSRESVNHILNTTTSKPSKWSPRHTDKNFDSNDCKYTDVLKSKNIKILNKNSNISQLLYSSNKLQYFTNSNNHKPKQKPIPKNVEELNEEFNSVDYRSSMNEDSFTQDKENTNTTNIGIIKTLNRKLPRNQMNMSNKKNPEKRGIKNENKTLVNKIPCIELKTIQNIQINIKHAKDNKDICATQKKQHLQLNIAKIEKQAEEEGIEEPIITVKRFNNLDITEVKEKIGQLNKKHVLFSKNKAHSNEENQQKLQNEEKAEEKNKITQYKRRACDDDTKIIKKPPHYIEKMEKEKEEENSRKHAIMKREEEKHLEEKSYLLQVPKLISKFKEMLYKNSSKGKEKPESSSKDKSTRRQEHMVTEATTDTSEASIKQYLQSSSSGGGGIDTECSLFLSHCQYSPSPHSPSFHIDFKGVGVQSFKPRKLLGKGSFGEVYLVQFIHHKTHIPNNAFSPLSQSNNNNNNIRHVTTTESNLFAMKIIKKNKIVSYNLVKYCLTERNVLSSCANPFIVKLYYSFQTNTKLYLILKFCSGGDLAQLIKIHKRMSEKQAKFYVCEIIMALEYLHKQNIIFRDLKPDNVVIDTDGHALLTDFGLSKEGISDNESATSFCGSIAYLAPEMIQRCGHGKSIDWYLLGVLLYEMIVGEPPYFTPVKKELFRNITSGGLKMPINLSANLKSLIISLMNRNPKKRLGAGPSDSEEIKSHPWFADVNWDDVYNKRIKPPYIPPKDWDQSLKLGRDPLSTERFMSENFIQNKNKIEGWTFVQTH